MTAKVLPCDKEYSQESSATSPTMSLIKEKNLKVIIFSGKQEDWMFHPPVTTMMKIQLQNMFKPLG